MHIHIHHLSSFVIFFCLFCLDRHHCRDYDVRLPCLAGLERRRPAENDACVDVCSIYRYMGACIGLCVCRHGQMNGPMGWIGLGWVG